MSKVTWYIVKAHIGPFLFGALTVMFVFLLNYLILYLPQLVGKGLGLWLIVQLVALNLAWMVTLAVPMGLLLATLMAFGNLGATNEVAIIKSGGGSLLSMMRPMLIIGVLMTAALFWFNDSILPEANYRVKTLMGDIQRKKPTFIVDKGQFSMQLEGYSILARDIDTVQGLMLGVTIYDNSSFEIAATVSADTGRINFTTDYAKVVLQLSQGELHQTNLRKAGDYRRLKFEQHRIIMDANGFAFSQSDASSGNGGRDDRTMKIADMRGIVGESERNIVLLADNIQKTFQKQHQYTFGEKDISVKSPTMPAQPAAENQPQVVLQKDSLKETTRKDAAWRTESRIAGILTNLDNDIYQMRDRQMAANKYLVEIHKKYVIPFACLVFVMIGCPLGVMTKRGNFGLSGAITLVFYVIFWIFLMTGERFADRGLLAPWLSMWLADIVLGLIGLFLMWRVSKDLPIVDLSGFYAVFRRKKMQR